MRYYIIFITCLLLFAFNAYAELPPEILLDKYNIAFENHYKNKNYSEALIYLEKLEKLNIKQPVNVSFKYGKVLLETKKYQRAKIYLEKFLTKIDKKNKKYKEALILYSRAEELETKQHKETKISKERDELFKKEWSRKHKRLESQRDSCLEKSHDNRTSNERLADLYDKKDPSEKLRKIFDN